jgi:putative ABC transport system permease protein
MIRHFIITYFRCIKINKQYAIVNYLGLMLAIAVVLLIFLFVKNELTYDKFHEDHQHVYRLTTTLKTPSNEYNVAFANTAFVHKLREELAEIEFIACVSEEESYLVKHGDINLREDLVRFSTPDIFKVFSYNIIKGDPERLLRAPMTAVLTETLSGKLFSGADPIGDVVLFNDEVYTVAGIIKDLPDNTDLKFSALLASPVNGSEHLMAWNDYFSYIRVTDKVTSDFQTKVDRIAESVYKPFFTGNNEGLSRTYSLQPIAKVHFDSSYLADSPKGNKNTVYIFLCIAFLILIIACINLINLNLARAIIRQKELSIRQVNGAGKKNLFVQLLVESFMSAVLSAVIAILIARSLLPVFNKLADTHFEFYVLTESSILIAIWIVVIFISLVTGIYPGVFQFHFLKPSPGNISVRSDYGFSKLSKGLVTFQFVLSIAMISVIIGVHKQMNHMQKFDLGFDQSQILSIDLNSVKSSPGNLQALKQELSTHFFVAAGGSGTQLGASGEWRKPLYELKNENGEEVQFILNMPEIDENYLNLFGIELIEGRNFSKDFPSDYNESIIINRTYAGLMGWNEPIGKRI